MALIEEGPFVVASTHRLDKYGGRFRLTIDDLDGLKARYAAGQLAHVQQHDPTKPSTIEVVEAWVGPLHDGESALFVRIRVDEDEWECFRAEAERRGAPGGFSYTAMYPFGMVGIEDPVLQVAADAAFFTQEEIAAAADASVPAFEAAGLSPSIELAELVQFSAEEICRIVVQIHQTGLLQQWVQTIAGGLVWPVLLGLAKLGTRIRYQVRFHRTDGKPVDAIVETDDPTVLAEAEPQPEQLESWLREPGGPVMRYDPEKKLWLPRDH